MRGRIVRIFPDKRFGFILGSDDKAHYFFHSDDVGPEFPNLAESYARGQDIHVEFDPLPSPKGLRARDIQRINQG